MNTPTPQQIYQASNRCDPIDAILADKRDDKDEFFINFFEYCNLNCSFCWQDHDSKVGIDTVVNLADKVISGVIASQRTGIDINIMGGELFCDEIEDRLFDDYRKFTYKVEEQAVQHGKQCMYNWVTNLIYSNTDRVQSFMDDLQAEGINTTVTTSFDFAGRFNPKTLNIFLENLEKLEDYVRSISVILTKQNIEQLLKDDNEVFKHLYKKFPGGLTTRSSYPPTKRIYFDYYSPGWPGEPANIAPSDELLYQGLTFLIDNYPECGPVWDWVNQLENKMTCRTSLIFLPTGDTGRCRLLAGKQEDFGQPITFVDNKNMELAFIEKNQCLNCEYFKRCGLGCYLHSDFMRRPKLPECVFKLIFDYITKGVRYETA